MSTHEPARGATGATHFEVTRFSKPDGGLMTKVISLNEDGTLNSDGGNCKLWQGTAERVAFPSGADMAEMIKKLQPNQAIAPGRLRSDLPASVPVTTKANLAPGSISRTADFIEFPKGVPAFAPIDVDTKGMPPEMLERINAAGGFWPVLCGIMPELIGCARVERPSTSSWIWRNDRDRGTWVKQESGAHYYIAVADGADIGRFLHVLADLCWLSGFGWMMIGAGGQLLVKSLVDFSVGRAEGLLFEGAPHLIPPLMQDTLRREPVAFDGGLLDTVEIWPPLSLVERSKLDAHQARERERLKPEALKARSAFEESRSAEIAHCHGRAEASPADRWAARRACEGNLLAPFILPFDDPALAGMTVAHVLANPERFVGETLADPLEGPGYGTCKAKILQRSDGSPWIHSFAHGRTTYDLFHNAEAVHAALRNAARDRVLPMFADLIIAADLAPGEHAEIRDQAAKLSGVGLRDLDHAAKQAKAVHDAAQAKEEHDRRAAERRDPRPQIAAPPPDAPWLPQMKILNDVLGASEAPEPPMRDINGVVTQVRVRRVPNMHGLTSQGTNAEEAQETRLPPPEQPLLTRLDEAQLAELIETHVDYVAATGRSVHLAAPFVKHFHTRTDDELPVVAAIATLPIVLDDGTLLAKRGLDRDRGIVFRVSDELLRILPKLEDCTPSAVAEAMRFLTDEWLCDVLTDYTGKCVLIAAALSIIERSVLPDRPAFFVTAGRRGGGKTTALIMLLSAVTGVRPSAAAWSSNEEERRKALLAYLLEGMPVVLWDNIPRGTQISCPHIEKACTSAFYSDRRLGVSEMVAVAASCVHTFTGNNIRARGDLASRSLQARIEVDRPDPENREFRHPDPIGWTEAHRGKILAALYSIVLGNPAVRPGSNVTAQTRFKAWWRLVGSAVEHAAGLCVTDAAARADGQVDGPDECRPVAICFRDLFLSQEEEDEESASLADALAALAAIGWSQPNGEPKKTGPFQAATLAMLLNTAASLAGTEKEHAETLLEVLFPDQAHKAITAKATSKRLKRHLDEPVKVGVRTLCLRMSKDPHSKILNFYVAVS